jgi:peroxin-5
MDPKGKGRAVEREEAVSHAQAEPFRSLVSSQPYRPTFQPMYSGYNTVQPNPTLSHLGRTQIEQQDLDQAFERALADAQSQTRSQPQTAQTTTDNEGIEEIIREPKGDLEAVWESLRPEAERLNKLAEWESEFSQFVNEEDDLYDSLNDSLKRADVGQSSLDEQFDLDEDEDRFGIADDGVPRPKGYEFGMFPSHLRIVDDKTIV